MLSDYINNVTVYSTGKLNKKLKGVQNHSDVDQIFMILKLVTLNCAECTRGVAKMALL